MTLGDFSRVGHVFGCGDIGERWNLMGGGLKAGALKSCSEMKVLLQAKVVAGFLLVS